MGGQLKHPRRSQPFTTFRIGGRYLLHVALVLWLILGTATGANNGYQREKVYAAFLYNISRFINWPISSFQTPQAPIHLCVLGKTELTSLLEEAVQDELIKGRPLMVSQLTELGQAEDCHLLFFTDISARLYADQLNTLQGKPILLVSTLSRFPQNGGMLALVEQGNRLRPVINLRAVKAAHITISSKLLRLATITGGDEE